MSEDSHVSVREMTSTELSDMNSCKMQGLLRESVTEEAERTFRQENVTDVVDADGPGFCSTSPQRRSIK